MESNQNNFKNVVDVSPEKKSHGTFGKTIVVPFLSGIIGAGIVVGTCFGVPSIKERIVGNNQTSKFSVTSNDVSAGTVDFVSRNLNTFE